MLCTKEFSFISLLLFFCIQGNLIHKQFSETLQKLPPSKDEVFVFTNKNAVFKDKSVNITRVGAALLADHYDTEIITLDIR